jgi:PAS domain S-box-containing protein
LVLAFKNCAHGIAIGLPGSNQVLTCNATFARLQQRAIHEIAGMPILSLYLPEDHPHILRSIFAADTTGSARFEAHMVRKDGSVFPVQMDIVSVRAQNGELIYRIGTHQDITERKQAEAALRISAEQYHALFETTQQGVLVQDAQGRVTNANPAAQRIFGLSLAELCGRTFLDPPWKAIREDGSAFPAETHPAVLALRTGQPVRDVIMGIYHPQTASYRWTKFNAIPQFISGEANPYQVNITLDDITESLEAAHSMNTLTERLDLATRAAQIGIWDWDIPKNTLIWDERMYQLYGIRQGEFPPAYESWLKGVHPDDRAPSNAISQQAVRGEG